MNRSSVLFSRRSEASFLESSNIPQRGWIQPQAPEEYQITAGTEQPAVLGYKAIARVTFQTGLNGELDTNRTLRMRGSFSGVGHYRGLAQNGRVAAEMAEKRSASSFSR